MNQEMIEAESRALELAIAKRIRKRRKRNDWTLEDLAKVTGLSKGHLSQIENGEKVPPIGTLTKIAFALGTTVSVLISGETAPPKFSKISFGRRENRMPIRHVEAASNTRYESFGFNKPDRIMDTYVVTVGPEFPPKALVHSGQEFVYVTEGDTDFYYDGKIYPLEQGEAVYFDSDRPHMGRSRNSEPAKVLVVFCNPPSKA